MYLLLYFDFDYDMSWCLFDSICKDMESPKVSSSDVYMEENQLSLGPTYEPIHLHYPRALMLLNLIYAATSPKLPLTTFLPTTYTSFSEPVIVPGEGQ